jgi:peptidoglycan/LPS O-acetylase OafA/YrhL
MKKTQENYYIDFLRFVCAIVIMCYHSWAFTNKGDSFFGFGNLAVNFYFVLTGYLMMNSLHNKKKDTYLFIWGKIKRLLPAIIISFIVSYIFVFGREALSLSQENITRLLSDNIIGDFFKLRAFGYGGVINSAWWYISAMIFVTAILYPLAKKYNKTYITYIAPMIIVITLAIKNYFNISFGYHSGITLIFANGVFKGLIYIAIGNISYEISKVFQKKYNNKKIIFTIAEVLLTILMIYNFYTGNIGNILLAIIIALLISISFSGISLTEKVFKHKVWKYIGNYGFYLYMVHEAVRQYYKRQNTYIYIKMFKKYAITSALVALGMFIIIDVIFPWITKHIKAKKNNPKQIKKLA